MIELPTALVLDLQEKMGGRLGTQAICLSVEMLFLIAGDRLPLKDLGILAAAAMQGLAATVEVDGTIVVHEKENRPRLAA